jgi:hypothetical protein
LTIEATPTSIGGFGLKIMAKAVSPREIPAATVRRDNQRRGACWKFSPLGCSYTFVELFTTIRLMMKLWIGFKVH